VREQHDRVGEVDGVVAVDVERRTAGGASFPAGEEDVQAALP
jgi:hypothetical protein